jgi:hypothetical protein
MNLSEENMDIQKAISCKYLAEIVGWSLSDEQLKEVVLDLNSLADKIGKLPEKTKRMLLRFVEGSFDGCKVFVDEFASERYSDEGKNIIENVNILNRYKLAEFTEDTDGNAIIRLRDDLWVDIKKFCEAVNAPLSQIIIDLNFAIFDGKNFIKKKLL